MKNHPLRPAPALLAKLGSIAVHVDEGLGQGGHAFDRMALASLLVDPEVADWLAEMRKLAMIPEKRG